MYLKPEQLTEIHYEAWVNHAKKMKLNITKVFYEYDEHLRLHMHCVGKYVGNLLKTRVRLPGYHQHIIEIKNLIGFNVWMEYCTKEQDHTRIKDQVCAIFEHANEFKGPEGVLAIDRIETEEEPVSARAE